MASTEALFNEADINHDGYLSQDEFRNFVSRNSTAGLNTSSFSTSESYNNLGISGGYDTTLFQSSEATGNLDGDILYSSAAYDGTSSSSPSSRSTIGNITEGITNFSLTGKEQVTGADAAYIARSSSAQVSNVQQYETDAQGNFKDSNPQIIRRASQAAPMTYQQNIQVRFLRPPPVPPPGPLIIKELRPPQPPVPAPLRVRQQAPPLPTPPPLILRERPPPKPTPVASQTMTKTLPAIPVPPRSLVIERMPPAPAKPRDIIIERWIPYGPMAQRKTVVQHAASVKPYPRPRNVIIEYDPPQVRVVRQFQRLGVTPENPEEYIKRHGTSLFDIQTLLEKARAAGVVEDISVPDVAVSSARTTSEVTSSSSSSSVGGVGFSASSGEHVDVVSSVGNGSGDQSSFYETTSYSTTGDISGLPSGLGALRSISNESYSYGSSTGGVHDRAGAIFSAADTNKDGTLSLAEFRNAGF